MKTFTTAFVFISLMVVLVSCERPLWNQLSSYTFERYIHDFGRRYDTAEELEQRRELFHQRLAEIQAHNKNPYATWRAGVNELTDRTAAELRVQLGYRKDIGYLRRGDGHVLAHQVAADVEQMASLPSSVDWRTKNVVSAVKDQGGCGSCWTFASAETIESHYALLTGRLMDISEQQILDCTPNPLNCGGSGGCAGGTAELAFATLVENGGAVASEWVYPYLSYRGLNFMCRYTETRTPVVANISGFIKLASNQYQPLMNAVANVGPIAISVDASLWSHYESGVFNGCDNVTNPDINHAVQLVGYGTDSTYGDYWLVRNSWSPSWGEKGYIRLKRSTTPPCAVDITPADGTGCRGGPSKVTVCGECGMLYDSSYPIIDL